MSDTATAIIESQTKRRYRFIVDRLLHRLRKFMSAYPRAVSDKMPEHDLVWVEMVNGESPGKTILDAIKAHPELWRDALPAEVCIVPRSTLEELGLSADVVTALADMGDHMVAAHAARFAHQFESR